LSSTKNSKPNELTLTSEGKASLGIPLLRWKP